MALLRAYRRFFVVAYQFLPLLLAYARDRKRFLFFGSGRTVDSATRRRRAQRLLESMLTLGPTFIKLGQLLSTRPDVLPPEYVEEFEQLQDNVPPAEWSQAKQVLEEDLGPIDERFAEFDTEAISGASLGQVYTAKVDGQPVAVKIRRPGIEELVSADLRVIRFSIPILMRFVDEARSFSLETLADEFEKTITEEMDYAREREMLEGVRGNFVDEPKIRIPRSVPSHSSGRVLTMEYVPGTKISELDDLDELGVDRHELAERLQRSYLQMLIVDGVFHADPHPGNLAVQDDGTIVFYDFGMSGRVDSFIQEKIVDFYAAVAAQDIDRILDTLIEMGTLSPTADRELMSDIMELAIQDARGDDIEQYRVNQIVNQVEDTIYEFPLRLPPNLALVLRVATVVEGVCVTLDPDFDFIAVATAYLRENGFLEDSARQFVEDRAREARQSVESVFRTPPKLETALDKVNRDNLAVEATLVDDRNVFDRLAKRLILGLLLTGTVLSTAILYAFSAPTAAIVPGVGTVVVAVLLLLSFRSRRGIRATPQFTRQSMRERRED
ncbi:AarF/ABC1/UbiB kinase family protein [Salinirubellus salinus]|uniref:AarF/ABC1/UbiB kinase family protein n=1 Tax=Salinirubellus salinus TaxID=1364945 RepID=A0A9E7R746_9EURY|nr:AarF/ABC1/UbiB kinase family protein [Salinirubellus salinus]UWM55915.1 AarF/ABC1/UbiB kinase family protein [Salinirubellus salinus]